MPPPPSWNETNEAPPGGGDASTLAITSLVLGVLGLVCFPAVGGVAAIAFGLAARSEILAPGARRSGLGVANAGIAIGAVSILLTALALGALVTVAAQPHRRSAPVATATPPLSAPPPSPVPPAGPASAAPSGAPGGPRLHPGVRTARVGVIPLVDLGPSVRSLTAELDEQRRRANKEGRKLLVWVSTDDCAPCNGVAASLVDPRIQAALADCYVVRVDTRDYRVELERLGIPTNVIPGFALLDTNNRPVDYLHGGEWDEDIPQNIAPVLERFSRGRYTTRRHDWEDPRGDTATPI